MAADISDDIANWSATAASNSPSGSTSVSTNLDDNLRAIQAAVKAWKDSILAQQSKSADYTLVLSDANKHVLHPTADNNARTFTIPANASVAFDIGTCITFINQINTVTIAITSDTMTLASVGSTGSRTLAANGIATAIKVGSASWVISGTGLS
jgi:hypothetical protein